MIQMRMKARTINPNSHHGHGWSRGIGQIVVVVVLVMPLAFAESFTCHVTGYIYTAPNDTPDLHRSDHCLAVRDKMHDDGTLVLQSRNWVVIIQVPPSIGQQKFWYRWGSHIAHLGGQTLVARPYLLFAA